MNPELSYQQPGEVSARGLPSHQVLLLPSGSPVTATVSWLQSTAQAELPLSSDTKVTSFWRQWDAEQKEMSCSKAGHWTKPFPSPHSTFADGCHHKEASGGISALPTVKQSVNYKLSSTLQSHKW